MSSNNKNSTSSAPTSSTPASSTPASSDEYEPTMISGWQHSSYAHKSERYAYMGKDEDTGEPQWLDWGPKGKR